MYHQGTHLFLDKPYVLQLLPLVSSLVFFQVKETLAYLLPRMPL